MQDDIFYIVGNWKSHKTLEEAVIWWQDFTTLWKKQPIATDKVKIVLCPAILHLTTLSSLISLNQIPLDLGAQDISAYPQGAYTGQTSAEVLKDLVAYSLIGHSERRKYCKEESDELEKKAAMCKASGIEPIFCVQEPDAKVPNTCSIAAYEPVWAIGTGTPETPENANQVAGAFLKTHPHIKKVLYGGSVTDKNVADYRAQTHIGGVLPGGASLSAQTFHSLIYHATNP